MTADGVGAWRRRGRVVGRAVLFASAAVPGAAKGAVAQRAPERLETEVAGRAVTLPLARHRAYPAVDVAELAAALGTVPGSALEEVTWSGVFLEARLRGEAIAFEAESPFFILGELTLQLVNPPYEDGGAFWLPAEFVTRWLSDAPPPVAVLPPPPPPADPLSARVDPGVAWRVIIDPGHGGRDPGTMGGASAEKDIVLAIGRQLAEELRGRALIEPRLTRDADVYLEHDARSRFAVDRAGDLFVSIHANAAPDESARGFETFFLGEARSEEAREVALRENRGPEVDGGAPLPSDIQFILTGMDRTENLTESRLFAGFVQNAIRRRTGASSRARGGCSSERSRACRR